MDNSIELYTKMCALNVTAEALANFALVLFEGTLTAEAARDALAEGGYAVRHLPGQGLGQALRITIGTAEQMDAIAAILRQTAEAAR